MGWHSTNSCIYRFIQRIRKGTYVSGCVEGCGELEQRTGHTRSPALLTWQFVRTQVKQHKDKLLIMAPKENNQELRAEGTRSPYTDENGRENFSEEVMFKPRHAVSQVRGEGEEWFSQREAGRGAEVQRTWGRKCLGKEGLELGERELKRYFRDRGTHSLSVGCKKIWVFYPKLGGTH